MRSKDPKRMQQIIDFVDAYYNDYHCTPTTREIAEHVGLSKSTVHSYLTEMSENGMIDYAGRMIVTDRINDKINEFNTALIIGSVPCGPLNLEEEAVEERVDLPMSIFGSGKLYILHAYGDSMTGAGIDEGDLLVVDRLKVPQDGDIVVAYVEGDGNTVKRFYKDDEQHRIILHPENEKYRDIVVKDCKIQGVVRNIIKKA